MILDLVALVGGMILLVVGGDWLVRGAIALARALNVPTLLIGLTVVAFGTSAPEMIVSVQAGLRNAPGIAYGNIVGSNIANVGLALGLPALICAVRAPDKAFRDVSFMLLGCIVFSLMTFDGNLSLTDGLILLTLIAAYVGFSARDALSGDPTVVRAVEEEIAEAPTKIWLVVLYLIGGLLALPFGADFLVGSASNIARAVGVDDAVIGLTAVAVGTSLPEIATALQCARRKQSDIIMGNVIGSNLFNVLAVGGALGVAGAVSGYGAPTPPTLIADNLVMLIAVGLCAEIVFVRMAIGRVGGLALIAAYAAYVAFIAVRA